MVNVSEITPRERRRRVLILCFLAIRNIAFHRASRKANLSYDDTQFWLSISNNFLDIAVLEWSKVFELRWDREKRRRVGGKHHWQRVVSQSHVFETRLYAELGISSQDFSDYMTIVKTYRDKFVAHLDDRKDLEPPDLELAVRSASFLISFIHLNDGKTDGSYDLMESPSDFYDRSFGRAVGIVSMIDRSTLHSSRLLACT